MLILYKIDQAYIKQSFEGTLSQVLINQIPVWELFHIYNFSSQKQSVSALKKYIYI